MSERLSQRLLRDIMMLARGVDGEDRPESAGDSQLPVSVTMEQMSTSYEVQTKHLIEGFDAMSRKPVKFRPMRVQIQIVDPGKHDQLRYRVRITGVSTVRSIISSAYSYFTNYGENQPMERAPVWVLDMVMYGAGALERYSQMPAVEPITSDNQL